MISIYYESKNNCNKEAILEALTQKSPLTFQELKSILGKRTSQVKKACSALIANGEIKPTPEGYVLCR